MGFSAKYQWIFRQKKVVYDHLSFKIGSAENQEKKHQENKQSGAMHYHIDMVRAGKKTKISIHLSYFLVLL